MPEGDRLGFVSLVGAGPGDPGLLTQRGRRAIERADVVLYDYLASQALLSAIEVPGQERIHVGKTAGPGRSKQAGIDRLIVRRAKAGDRVVRLKGGDPFVFGRGGEEAEVCAAEGIPFEVIPGVSSVSAAPTYAGIPLTHRDVTSSVVVATGHEKVGSRRVRWSDVAKADGTIVVVMGVLQAARWTRDLIEGGLAPETPAAVVRWGTTPRQRTVVATLETLPERIAEEGIRPPATAIVGEVVRYRERIAWFDRRPLSGHVVGITRSARGDSNAFEPLEDLGAAVLHVPLTRQQPVDGGRPLVEAVSGAAFTDLVFTSANGVRAFATALRASGRDARSLHGVSTWAVGPGTARAMRETLALGADHMPEDARGEGLVALAGEVGVGGRRFLFPASAIARRTVPDGLAALGATVDEVPSYETVPDPLAPARLESAVAQGLSLVAVASPSAVDALVDAMDSVGHDARGFPVAAIGPTTAGRARERDVPVAVVAETHTIAGLADAAVAWARSHRPDAPR
ncbi:MAG: uroporphyrinogen-III C-methyltransferase [Myxococcota bacterium]